MKQGAVLEYAFTDGKGAPLRDRWRDERWLRMTVEQVWGDTVANVRIDNQEFERLGKMKWFEPLLAELRYGDVMSTAAGVTSENMQWYFSPVHTILQNYGDEAATSFETRLSVHSFLPRGLKTGMTLPEEPFSVTFDQILSPKELAEYEERMKNVDETVTRRVDDNGVEVESAVMPSKLDLKITGNVTNRRVAGRERVTTPAGTFECWKIEYDLVGPREGMYGVEDLTFEFDRTGNSSSMSASQLGFAPTVTACVDYVSPAVGLVRRERMSDSGRRVVEIMELKKYIE